MIRFLYLIFSILLLSSCKNEDVKTSVNRIELNADWQFRKLGDSLWYPAKVPGVVHTDLLNNGLIDDPYWRNNELDLQWIENEDWEYHTTISIDQEILERQRIEINFKGLDTYAKIYLNDSLILQANNMFRTWKIEIKELLKLGSNDLSIVFLSPIQVNKSQVDSLGYELPAGCETVETKVSPFTRKSAYHFGWDWGPRFVTCGIWRPIELLVSDNIQINNTLITFDEIHSKYAVVTYEIDYHAQGPSNFEIQIDDRIYPIDTAIRAWSKCKFTDTIIDPILWWPRGHGEQHLYSRKIKLLSNSVVVDSSITQFGIRSVELINEPDSIGTSFYFKVNGKSIFIKGANYIPQDMFLPSVSDSQYRALLTASKDAGLNMLRVWGGGIYENDIFYNLCDSLGLLVWQDFMFAGSMYPGDDKFLNNIGEEAHQNINRLNNHPCIALWCGNNEMNVAWHNWGWQKKYNYTPTDSAEIWNNYLAIFDTLLADITKGYGFNYVSTSPQSNWGKSENFNHGSMHYWGVWHGHETFEDFKLNVGRFMVEYGFQSYPLMKTISKFSTEQDWSLTSEVMTNRQKSYIGNSEIEKMVNKYHLVPQGFDEFVSMSQTVQAAAMDSAITSHINSNGHCMGSMFWQLNDCWSGPSWSVIDYYGEKKVAYFTVQRLFLETE